MLSVIFNQLAFINIVGIYFVGSFFSPEVGKSRVVPQSFRKCLGPLIADAVPPHSASENIKKGQGFCTVTCRTYFVSLEIPQWDENILHGVILPNVKYWSALLNCTGQISPTNSSDLVFPNPKDTITSSINITNVTHIHFTNTITIISSQLYIGRGLKHTWQLAVWGIPQLSEQQA